MAEPQPPICDYEDSDYQQRFWDQANRQYEDQVEAIALKQLLPARGDLLLELGAGAGRNTPRYTGYKQVVLLDYSLSQLRLAKQKLGKNQSYIYVAADIYKLPFVDGLFDTATMIRTLHHMADPLAALRQVQRTLQPGATFILEYANKKNLKAIMRYILKRQEWSPFSLESVEFEKLNFDFHPAMIRKWLAQAGFTLQQQLAVSYFRLGLFKKLLPLSLLVKLDTILQPSGNSVQFSPSVFTRSKAAAIKTKAAPGTFFICPACGSNNLTPHGFKIVCFKCGHEWPITDGIFDFRIQASPPASPVKSSQ